MYDEITNSDLICTLIETACHIGEPYSQHAELMLEAARRIEKLDVQARLEGAPRPEPTPVPQQRPTARVAPASGTALQMQDELDIEMRFILNKDARTAIEIPTQPNP